MGRAVGGRDLDPAVAVLKSMVHHDAEAQFVGEETQASFLVAYEDDDEVQAQVRIFAVETETGSINAEGQFRGCHRRDYTGAGVRVSPTKFDQGRDASITNDRRFAPPVLRSA